MVAIARGVVGTRRVGHTGTLDPFATGLLVLLIGQATRLAQYVDGEPKVYEATIQFGDETDTDDATGAVTRSAPPPARDAIDQAISRLTGPIQQVPPAFSAKRTAGVRAYDAARRGNPIDLPPSAVTVHAWTVIRRSGAELDVRIECSGGTYIRALGRDLGRLSGSAAHVSSLRRIASGRFSVADAVTVENLRARQGRLLDMREAIASLPTQPLTAEEAARVSHGGAVEARIDGETAVLVTAEGRVSAVACRSGSTWQPVTVLAHD